MIQQIHWDIRNEGRRWIGDEFAARRERMPEKLEVIEGRVLWDDRELLTTLGMMLEQVGADRAVQLGELSVWRRAVRRRQRRVTRSRWRRVMLTPLDPSLVVQIVGELLIVVGILLTPHALGAAIVHHPIPVLLVLAGLMIMSYSTLMVTTKRYS